MKQLDARLKGVESIVYALEATSAGVVESAPPEWLDDVLVGVIAALRQLRQQGAWSLAEELEAKYFPDGLDEIGDELTTASSLKRSGG